MSLPHDNLIASIREALARFSLSDDNWNKVPKDYIKDQIKIVRSSIIREFVDNNKAVPDRFYQRICCLDVLCEDLSCTYEGQSIPTGQTEWYVEVEGLEQVKGNIKYLGDDTFKHPWTKLSLTEWQAMEGRVFTGGKPFYTQLEDRLLLSNKPTSGLSFLCGIMLYEDPELACSFDQASYPIPLNVVYRLQIRVLKHIGTFLGISPDVVNNAIADMELPQMARNVKQLPEMNDGNTR